MTNRKRQRRLKAKLKADTRALQSSRVARELSTLNEKNNMNENNRKYNDNRNNREFGSNSQSVVNIVNEEFAKNATPDVTKAAILARLNDDCIDGTQDVLSFGTQALKDAAIKADAANPVSAQHTADLAAAEVTG